MRKVQDTATKLNKSISSSKSATNSDEEYRDEVYEMLEELMDEERRIHKEVIEDLKQEDEEIL